MKHLLRPPLIVVVLVSVFIVFTNFAFMGTQLAAAASGCIVFDLSGGATGATGTFSYIQGHEYLFQEYAGGTLVGEHTATAPTTGSDPEPVAAGSREVITDLSGDCGGNGFFTPGDGRIVPLPGDRVAVYCNTAANPPTLDVWGVTNDSQGHRLYTFMYADLVKAGTTGIVQNVEPLGSVVSSTDGNGNFFVQWFGGPASATGTKDFAKSFTCSFPK